MKIFNLPIDFNQNINLVKFGFEFRPIDAETVQVKASEGWTVIKNCDQELFCLDENNSHRCIINICGIYSSVELNTRFYWSCDLMNTDSGNLSNFFVLDRKKKLDDDKIIFSKTYKNKDIEILFDNNDCLIFLNVNYPHWRNPNFYW